MKSQVPGTRDRRRARAAKANVATAACFVLMIACHVPAAAYCVRSTSSPVSAPAVTFLRSYRAPFKAPARMAVDASGAVYVTDPVAREIVVRASDGSVSYRKTGFGYPLAIAIDAAGRIYLGDTSSGAVTAFDSSWNELFKLGSGNGEFLMPNDIAIDAETGEIYVVDSKANTVKVYGAAGTFARSFGEPGSSDGQFLAAAGVAVDATAGEVFVSDSLEAEVHVFDRSGDFQRCFGRRGSSAGKFGMPQGLWLDGEGRVYVADTFDGRVQVVDTEGGHIAYIGEFGEKAGSLRIPAAVAVDPFQRLYVAATNNARLEVFGLDEFSDPEVYVPAALAVRPTAFGLSPFPGTVGGYVEIPGYALGQVSVESIAANSTVPVTGAGSVGDFDADGLPDLALNFDRTALLATLPAEGEAEITVRGNVGGLVFETSASVRVIDTSVLDADTDGTPDSEDRCPSTGPGDVVLRDGCGLAELCSCERDASGTEWPSHRDYVRCVGGEVRIARRAGKISWATQRDARRTANRSTCGALCPNLSVGDVQGIWVCIDERCPCEGPEPGVAWDGVSSFMRCVRNQARVAGRAGLISYDDRRTIIAEAKNSGCGAPGELR